MPALARPLFCLLAAPVPLAAGDKAPKNYCPGVGFVRDDDGLELVAVYENASSPARRMP